MRNYLTSTRLVTKLQMLRNGKKSKTFVIVEGITDYRVYGKLFDKERCEIIIGESKENVMEAIKTCEKQHLQGIIGIVDADFWHLTAQKEKLSSILFITDFHNLECMMLQSEAYEHVLLEYADRNKLAKFERTKESTLREWLLANVEKIGYLRRISLEKHLDLRFNQLDYLGFIEKNELEINQQQLIQTLLFHSHKQGSYKKESIEKWLVEARQQQEDPWQICCGHDLMEFLALVLSERVGNYNAKKLFPGQLEGSFRLAYHEKMFENTQLYQDLSEWEKSQGIYYLFKESMMNKTI